MVMLQLNFLEYDYYVDYLGVSSQTSAKYVSPVECLNVVKEEVRGFTTLKEYEGNIYKGLVHLLPTTLYKIDADSLKEIDRLLPQYERTTITGWYSSTRGKIAFTHILKGEKIRRD